VTRLEFNPIRFLPGPTLTQTHNWNRLKSTSTRPIPKPIRVSFTRSSPDPNFNWFEAEPDPNLVHLKLTQIELNPNRNQIRSTQTQSQSEQNLSDPNFTRSKLNPNRKTHLSGLSKSTATIHFSFQAQIRTTGCTLKASSSVESVVEAWLSASKQSNPLRQSHYSGIHFARNCGLLIIIIPATTFSLYGSDQDVSFLSGGDFKHP